MLRAERWDRIEQQRDERFARERGGYRVASWGRRHLDPDVEYFTRDGGRILSVR